MSDDSPEKSVGTVLREARQARGLSVEELHQRTRIMPQYIELLEQDNFDFFPEPYVRGFVRSICEVLEIDPEPLLERIHQLLHPPELEEPEAAEEKAGAAPSGRARPGVRRTGDFVLVGLVVLVIGGLIYGYTRYKEKWFGPGGREVREIPLEEALKEKRSQQRALAARRSPASAPKVRLKLGMRTTDSCWVRVVADDSVEHEYLFGPNGRQQIQATQKLYIKTGNAGALLLTLNGKEVGALGQLGEVVELWIDAQGNVRKRGRRTARVSPAGQEVE